MSIKLERVCSRCRRTEYKSYETVAEAGAAEERVVKKAAALKSLLALIKATDAKDFPPLIVIKDGHVLVHEALCDGEDVKRSCAKRVSDLLEQIQELDERKPRTKKEKAAPAEATTPPKA